MKQVKYIYTKSEYLILNSFDQFSWNFSSSYLYLRTHYFMWYDIILIFSEEKIIRYSYVVSICINYHVVCQSLVYNHPTQGKFIRIIFMRLPFPMKIMRISCEKVIHVYHAKKIYIVHVKIMRLSCDFRTY